MKFKKINLQTLYLQTLREFYSSVLELPSKMGYGELEVTIGNTELLFTEATTGEPFYHFAINIPANKIDEAKAWLGNKVKLLWMEDYQSDIADFVTWHAKSVYFFDPAGNILELIARFDLGNEAEDPFSSAQFLSISEIGLVFEQTEFDVKVTELLNKYSLNYFGKQPPLPQFRAIGDDEGLFIAVPAHRNWFPTDKPAGIFPISIGFEHEGENYEFKYQ
jgi:hypothetical protein